MVELPNAGFSSSTSYLLLPFPREICSRAFSASPGQNIMITLSPDPLTIAKLGVIGGASPDPAWSVLARLFWYIGVANGPRLIRQQGRRFRLGSFTECRVNFLPSFVQSGARCR